MSETTYILKVSSRGEITREEFRADDSLQQLQNAVRSENIISQSSPLLRFETICWEDRDWMKHITFRNDLISEMLCRNIMGNVAFSGLDEKFNEIGLTIERCDELEEFLNQLAGRAMRQAKSPNGEAEAVRNAVGRESVP